MKHLIYFFLIIILFSCKEKSYVHEVNEIDVAQNNADKNKEKTPEIFINIAYANLYQEALSANRLVDATEVVQSIGDKQVAYETLIAKMMVDPEVILPTNAEMRDDLETFVEDTYKRFFVRIPTEAEKTWWINYLESHPNLTAEHVFFSMATSNEYNFY
ncbi:MAG: hypothetical protein ACI9XO_000165 [Paraglaciecola sp.]|jgi:hypothetical protein